ncbi:MAG: phosphate acyltransferase PlsX [Gammaproteobacteria bacterium]|nr:phosphate acyltransferase PlsX [Gammaproteobacteria bacterium]
MGGDYGPPVTVPAALDALKRHPELKLALVGDESRLLAELKNHHAAPNDRLSIRHASQIVEMDDKPSFALRNKKDSSMRVAIELVKEGEAQAIVSAGNTGALMATARFVLKMLPGVDRPAIIAALPSKRGHTHMLDLGANVDVDSETLFQFAIMGSVLVSAVEDLSNPRVGLLNVGEEEIKGNDQVKQAGALLAECPSLNYIGFVEGNDIYLGDVDVVVCDGFVGNSVLKASEGIAKMIGQTLKDEFKRNWLTKLAALLAMPVLKGIGRRINPDKYNGASLVGLRGIVIKSHGGASRPAFLNAIEEAMREVEKDVPQRIKDQLEAILVSRV